MSTQNNKGEKGAASGAFKVFNVIWVIAALTAAKALGASAYALLTILFSKLSKVKGEVKSEERGVTVQEKIYQKIFATLPPMPEWVEIANRVAESVEDVNNINLQRIYSIVELFLSDLTDQTAAELGLPDGYDVVCGTPHGFILTRKTRRGGTAYCLPYFGELTFSFYYRTMSDREVMSYFQSKDTDCSWVCATAYLNGTEIHSIDYGYIGNSNGLYMSNEEVLLESLAERATEICGTLVGPNATKAHHRNTALMFALIIKALGDRLKAFRKIARYSSDQYWYN